MKRFAAELHRLIGAEPAGGFLARQNRINAGGNLVSLRVSIFD